jgi:hypothetical protein
MKPINWIRVSLGVLVAAIIACATIVPPTSIPTPGVVVIEAQSLPYTLTVTWTASTDTGVTGYNCYLDSALMVANATATTCQFAVTALGAHTVKVTAVNPTAIPSESSGGECAPPLPTSCAFTLRQPTPASSVKVK